MPTWPNKEVGATYFEGVGRRHKLNGLATAKVAKPLYALKDAVYFI